MNSCLYTGRITHRRFSPRRHTFSYTLFMVYLDLAELDQVFCGRWLWSTGRPALAWFRRQDHFGDPALPLDTCVRDLVQRQTGRRPQGPIRLLTHLRYFGYCFNPISIYYCFDPSDSRLETIVAEVTNTPWGERHCYVLAQPSQPRHRYQFPKALHVSPFMPMALDYAWRCNEPGERLGVHMDVLAGTDKLFDATLTLRRRAISGPVLAGILLRFPAMTLKVIVAIYWEALRLWRKQVPFIGHPANPSKTAGGFNHE
jgi:DUF1365 family protein